MAAVDGRSMAMTIPRLAAFAKAIANVRLTAMAPRVLPVSPTRRDTIAMTHNDANKERSP